MKKITFFFFCIITAQMNAMIISAFPKELNSLIYNHIPRSSVFSSVTEVNDVLKSLAMLNKSWSLRVNNSENTLSLIKNLSHRFDISNEKVAEELSIASAQYRYTLQLASLNWSATSTRVCHNIGQLCKRGLDLNFTYDSPQFSYVTMLMKITCGQAVGLSDIGKWLIKRGADINVVTKDGKSALMLALCYFNEKMITLFLQHPHLNVQHTDNCGNSILHYCFKEGINAYPGMVSSKKCAAMCPIIKVLLEKGVDPHAVNSAGETALDLAKKTEHAPFLEILDSSYNS